MSVGSNLQEMENVVTKGAKPAEPMPKLTTGIPDGQTGNWEDLGGPSPENYKSDDDSAKLKEPSATLMQVKNVVNKGAKAADAMPTLKGAVKEEEELDDENVISEEESDEVEEEVIEDEEVSSDEVEEEEEEEEEEVEEDYDIEEDVQALLHGEDLSEEFQEKAKTIFEAAIRSKAATIKEQLKEQIQTEYEYALIEQVQEIKNELTERVDSYLEYVADEWMSENQLAVERGIKSEISENILIGMKNLFEENYVSIPEDKYDVLESMVDKLDEMEGKLNEQIEKNVALNRRLAESVADVIFAEVTEGLALSQKDKLASLAENVEFDGEENYREKLVTLRESYFPRNASTQRDTSENLSEESQVTEQAQVSNVMENYLQVLSRVAKK
jgi:hypothetical protein